ncbi:MAG: hypothetical protein ACE37H_06715 [Phycisphaeraceae bacterium]
MAYSTRALLVVGLLGLPGLFGSAGNALAQAPVEVGFLWHMHQPQYRPGETVLQTQASGVFSFDLVNDVHGSRSGPYTTWPRDAVQSGLSLPNLGAQVSFSGSLIQNLNTLETAGVNGGQWNNWDGAYRQAANWDTAEGNPRLDLVNFGFNHPLMPLLDERDIRMQVKLQKRIHERTWGPGVPLSKGLFPPETAFSTRIIPALVAEGIEWSIVDSIHIERATQGYPHTDSSNLYRPNKADQINPALPDEQWVQLNNLWAPSKVAAPFAYRPHHVQHVDPDTGAISKIVAVPAARYEGNEDGRGGFGALQYEQVMDQYRQFNTDPARPMFVVLHHDGDNFGGGSEAYYHGNFNNMVNWAQASPNYNVSTIQDYLDKYPVPADAVVHIENGSWAGADNGDPEFKKWLGDPDPNTGWSPDRNSWAVLTAAKNRVFTADDIAPATNLDHVIDNTGTPTERAWHDLMSAQASDHWYWDGTEVWDSNVTRGSNLAVAHADQVINAFTGLEATAPSVFIPQRESYNPGGEEFGQQQPGDFEVWTYAYDVSGLQSIVLKYRIDEDGENPLDSIQNETYAGGAEVGEWVALAMSASDVGPQNGVLAPTYRAERFAAVVAGLENVLVDYYVEAVDGLGNLARTYIQHVWVGADTTTGGGDRVTAGPGPIVAGELTLITYDPAGGPLAEAAQVFLHHGFNDWQAIAADTPMQFDAQSGLFSAQVLVDASASQLDLVFNNGAGVWDNNGGADWHFAVNGGQPPVAFVMDGELDETAELVASGAGRSLHAAFDGQRLYVATDDAGEGEDVFIYLAQSPGGLTDANWAKAGRVAQWDAFLADENDNGYHAWFDAQGAVESATGDNGGVLEGVIDLLAEFGTLPDAIYLAVGVYGTADGTPLNPFAQLPASLDGDGDLDALEFVRFALSVPLPGDTDADGDIDDSDLGTAFSNYTGPLPAGTGNKTLAQGDADGDGDVDDSDLGTAFSAYTGPLGSANVPEPVSVIALLVAAGWVGRPMRRMASTGGANA